MSARSSSSVAVATSRRALRATRFPAIGAGRGGMGCAECRAGAFDRRAALGLTIGGVPGIVLAAWLVKSLPLDAVRWLVVVVVLYTAVTMWRSSLSKTPATRAVLLADKSV